jgi:hypothetical protein
MGILHDINQLNADRLIEQSDVVKKGEPNRIRQRVEESGVGRAIQSIFTSLRFTSVPHHPFPINAQRNGSFLMNFDLLLFLFHYQRCGR